MYKVDFRQAHLEAGYSTRFDEITNIAPRGVNPFSNDKSTPKLDTFRPPDGWLARDRLQPTSRALYRPFFQRYNPHTEDFPQHIDTTVSHSFKGKVHPWHSVRLNPRTEGDLKGSDRSGRYSAPIWRNTPQHPFNITGGAADTTEGVKALRETPEFRKLKEVLHHAVQTNAGINLDLKGAYADYKLTVPQLVSMLSADVPVEIYNERTTEKMKMKDGDFTVSVNPNPNGQIDLTIVGTRGNSPITNYLRKAIQDPLNIGGYEVKGNLTAPVLQNPELRENVRVNALPQKKLMMTYPQTPDGYYPDCFDPMTGLNKTYYNPRAIGDMNPHYAESLEAPDVSVPY
jgi:hypothetical protein